MILAFGYCLKDRGRFFLTSFLLSQRSNVSLKEANRKHTQVGTIRLTCDGETENMSARCLSINPSLNFTRVMTNSSSSFKTLFGPGLLCGSFPFISIFLLLALITLKALADNLKKEHQYRIVLIHRLLKRLP